VECEHDMSALIRGNYDCIIVAPLARQIHTARTRCCASSVALGGRCGLCFFRVGADVTASVTVNHERSCLVQLVQFT